MHESGLQKKNKNTDYWLFHVVSGDNVLTVEPRVVGYETTYWNRNS